MPGMPAQGAARASICLCPASLAQLIGIMFCQGIERQIGFERRSRVGLVRTAAPTTATLLRAPRGDERRNDLIHLVMVHMVAHRCLLGAWVHAAVQARIRAYLG